MSRDLPAGRLARLTRLAALGPRAGLAFATDRDAVGAVLAETLGKLKGGSLKVGQLLAQVADDLPLGARVDLGRLFGEAPALPPEAVEAQVAGLGFASFDREPFAAASLGQVHGAVLPDGTRVAVKVQYPGVEAALAHDLDLLSGVSIAGSAFDGRKYFLALRALTLSELDYAAEADRADAMRAALGRWPDLVVPRVHRVFSNGRVLTLDRLDGPTLHAWLDAPAPPDARRAVADRLIRAVFGPLATAGLVNADAHPGNFVVIGESLGLLDFGAVASVGCARGAVRLLDVLRSGDARSFRDALPAAGVDVRLAERRAADFTRELYERLVPGFRGPHDFAADSVLARVGALKMERPRDLMHLRFDPELLPVLRAALGVHHALRRMAVPIDAGACVAGVLGGRAPTSPPRTGPPR